MTTRAEVVARARACVGVRFRAQGRDPQAALDCVGLAAFAAGVPLERARADYALRGGSLARLEREAAALGLRRIADEAASAGDLVIARAGAEQLHVVVLTGTGFVHADAGLRRVVERPGAVTWPVLSAWRVGEG